MTVTDAEVEAAAKALVTSRCGNPMTLLQFNVFTGDEPFDHEDTSGRRFIYSWRKQVDNAKAALLAASQARALSSGEGEVQDILRAVAFVGVDFGFGPYVLDDRIIAAARALLDPQPPSKDNTNE